MLWGSSKRGHFGPNDSDQSYMPPLYPTQEFPPIGVDDTVCFRRTITYQSQVMQTLDEALEALSKDERDTKANQFMGWWYLTQENEAKRAIEHLEAAEESGIIDHHQVNTNQKLILLSGTDYTGQTLYLLGRAFSHSVEDRLPHGATDRMDSMSAIAMRKAHEYYQRSIHRNGRSPSCWLSIARFFYMMGQPRDSLDNLARAMRLNPFRWEFWYNLGVLVSFSVPRPWSMS